MRAFLLVLVLCSQTLFASGWRCSSSSDTWSLKLYNHVDPNLGTTNVSQIIVQEDGKTLVHRFSPFIDVLETSKGTTYKTMDAENSYGCVVGFHIGFREGVDSIPDGAKRMGKLFLSNCDDEENESSYSLSCKRYLKNP